MATRLAGIGLGAGFCVVLGALPAGAVTLGPATLPSLPPLEVAPGPVTVGPVTVAPTASVTPDGSHVGVATGGLPLPDGGPDLGVSVGTDGAQVGVGGVEGGVVLSPPPSTGDGWALTPGVAAPRSSSAPARGASSSASSVNPAGVPTPAPQSKVVTLSNGSPVAVTGGLDAPRPRNWWSLATGAARSSFLWIVLLLAALVIRDRVGAALRDQRGVSVARRA